MKGVMDFHLASAAFADEVIIDEEPVIEAVTDEEGAGATYTEEPEPEMPDEVEPVASMDEEIAKEVFNTISADKSDLSPENDAPGTQLGLFDEE